MITLDDSKEPRAKMSCGHVISSQSMLMLLESIAAKKQPDVFCPAPVGNN